MNIIGVAVRITEGGKRIATIEAEFDRNEDVEADDVARLAQALDELNGAEGSRDPDNTSEEEPEQPKPRRRRKKAEAEENEAEETEAEETEEKPKRRRRKKAEEPEDTGPTQEDVAKASSALAEAHGNKFAGEIIAYYSDTGKLADIPADKRQAFLDEVDNELYED